MIDLAQFDLETERIHGDRINRSGSMPYIPCPYRLKLHYSTTECMYGEELHLAYEDAVRRGDEHTVAWMEGR